MDVEKWLGSINLYEAAQIWSRFTDSCEPNELVLWCGVGFVPAENWARQHGRKTLTQAMGPLMDKSNPFCRYNFKHGDQWQRYVHAASILFTLYISNGDHVVVLTPQPPQRLNPRTESYYQIIEEPWLKACCDANKFKIMFAHPKVKAAEGDTYQYWPVDEVENWIARYPKLPAKTTHWQHRIWDNTKMSEYQPMDLRRERNDIMEKLYLYKTGASIYWVVAVCLTIFDCKYLH